MVGGIGDTHMRRRRRFLRYSLARVGEGEEDDHEDAYYNSEAPEAEAVVDLFQAAVDLARHALLLWRDAAHHRAAR